MSHRLLVDLANLAYRAHHGFGGDRLIGPDGSDQTVLHGLLSMTLGAADKVGATHISVALEPRTGGSRRRALYTGYKAARHAPDDTLRTSLDAAVGLVALLGWDPHAYPGEEADDVLATLARLVSADGGDATILTSDLDLLGAVGPRVSQLWIGQGLAKAITYTPAVMLETKGVAPARWAEYKALVGDSSDGYPGCPGVGPKAALGLLAAYPSLAALEAALPEVKPDGLRKRLVEGWADLAVSHELAQLHTDLPLPYDAAAGSIAASADPTRLAALRELGLRAMADRLERLAARARPTAGG